MWGSNDDTFLCWYTNWKKRLDEAWATQANLIRYIYTYQFGYPFKRFLVCCSDHINYFDYEFKTLNEKIQANAFQAKYIHPEILQPSFFYYDNKDFISARNKTQRMLDEYQDHQNRLQRIEDSRSNNRQIAGNTDVSAAPDPNEAELIDYYERYKNQTFIVKHTYHRYFNIKFGTYDQILGELIRLRNSTKIRTKAIRRVIWNVNRKLTNPFEKFKYILENVTDSDS